MKKVSLEPAWACSEFLLNNSGDSVVSARTMDFALPLDAAVIVVPREEEFQSHISEKEKFRKWTSKYAFIGTNGNGQYTFTDGLNEKGLSVGLLWLCATQYPDYTKVAKEKVVIVHDLIHFLLGTCSSVDEVRAAMGTIIVSAFPDPVINMNVLSIHLSIHDSNKKSLVVEFLGGKVQFYENPYMVLSNDPPFPQAVEALQDFAYMSNQNFKDPLVAPRGNRCGMHGLPGDSSSLSRFIRLFVLNRFVAQSKTTREAVNNALHILNRVTLVNGEMGEFTETDPDMTAGITLYGLVRDHKNLVYYVVDNQNMNIRAFDLKKIDLSKDAPRLQASIANDNWYREANSELRPYEK
jgi:choloylglycine hydrolase